MIHRTFPTVLSAVLIFCFSSAYGQNPQEQGPRVDPQAEQVLRRQAEFFKGLQSLSVQVRTQMNMEMQGMKQDMTSVQTVAVQRPNKLAVRQREGMGGGTIVSDGEKLFVHIPMFPNYLEKAAPASLNDLMDDEVGMLMAGSGGGAMIFAPLFADDPYAAIMEDVQAVEYVGAEEIDGVRHHRLRVVEEGITIDVWVRDGERPVINRMVPDLTEQMQEMARQNPEAAGMKMEVAVEFSGWTIDQPLPDDSFAFTPPAQAQRVESMRELFAGMGPQAGPDAQHANLLGRPAPEFELDLLEDGRVNLAQHKDRDIVILDFWATWCGPCIAAMPSLMEVADQYKDRNVVFYAINLRERPEQVRQFLQQREWTMKVPMDNDGSVADKFGVTGIPQTVIIGKDGVVEVIHVGFLPDLKERLSGELNTLLEGGRLAERE